MQFPMKEEGRGRGGNSGASRGAIQMREMGGRNLIERWVAVEKITTFFRSAREGITIGSPRSAETDTGIFVTEPLSSYVPPFQRMSSSRPPLTRSTLRCGRSKRSLSLSLSLGFRCIERDRKISSRYIVDDASRLRT